MKDFTLKGDNLEENAKKFNIFRRLGISKTKVTVSGDEAEISTSKSKKKLQRNIDHLNKKKNLNITLH